MEIKFNNKEILLLQDTDFLLAKGVVLTKVKELLQETRNHLRLKVEGSSSVLPERLDVINGKISRGENYKNLPYLVLDYPALFKADDIFSYRTMFWWGNFFSATLHLQYRSLDYFRDSLIKNIDKFVKDKIYISIGQTPWEYHFGGTNYELITNEHLDHLKNCSFIKLSKKLKLNEWERLPAFSSKLLEFFLRNLQ